jgi:hypothetical protein
VAVVLGIGDEMIVLDPVARVPARLDVLSWTSPVPSAFITKTSLPVTSC